MKIAPKTLNRYLKKPRTTAEIIKLLERTEIEVEQIISSEKLDPNIILVKIVEVFPHPNADRLRLVTVSDGSKKYRVVCGAPNVELGLRVAYAQPGVTLPDGLVLEKRKIRGEVSDGMLASSKELGLSDDHTGIWVLEEASARHSLGTSLCDIIGNDDVLDIKTPANRWDYLSGEGIGREIAAYDVVSQSFIPVETGEYTYSETEYVNVKERQVNPRIASAHVRIKKNRTSPSWLVDNLRLNGMVPHNVIVDITNFVMLELGQPAHAYDASTLSGSLSTRLAEAGEKLTTLDEVDRILTNDDMVVCDQSGPISLAGIMGSAHTQITPDTTDVILEVATWDKTRIRRTALRQGLRTEASARFERGLPLPLAVRGLERILDLLKEICDAELVEGPFDQLYAWPWQQQLGLRLRRAESLLGTKLSESQVITGMRRLGFEVEHFSISKAIQQHIGKPYKWAANYRQDGETAFDCSYLVDRIYSKIGVFVGHTALGQYHHGAPVESGSLKPGDVIFIEGKIEKSSTDHYYTTTPQGVKQRIDLEAPERVGHNAIYLGDGKVVQAAEYQRDGDGWKKRTQGGVIISPVEELLDDPGYLGARRYVDSFNHILAVRVPWWRTDVRMETDLVEDIGKLIDYNALPVRLPLLPPPKEPEPEPLLDQMRLRQWLAGAGHTEIVTYSFISDKARVASGLPESQFLPIANPRSPEQAYLRASLLPSHIDFWRQQPTQVSEATVCFELSRVFVANGLKEQPQEIWRLGLSATGDQALEQVQSSLHRLAEAWQIDLKLLPGKAGSTLVPQRSAQIMVNGKVIGEIGQVNTKTRTALDLDGKRQMAWLEIEIESWLGEKFTRPLPSLPEYQLVWRDVSLELPVSLWWQEIESGLKMNSAVWSVEFLSEFTSDELVKEQRRVITLRLSLDCGPRPAGESIEALIRDLLSELQMAWPKANLTTR